MGTDRRRVLGLLGSGVLVSCAPSTLSAKAPKRPKAAPGGAALLVPATGRWAGLGASMQLATRLAHSEQDGNLPFAIHDTGEDSSGAGKAAAAALRGGAKIILGPVFGAQLAAVAGAAGGKVPIISFSNSLAAPPPTNTFLFGITPAQSVSAVLQYARGRGVRRVALVGDGTQWSERAQQAARRLAGELDVEIVQSLPASATGAALLESLNSGGLPDAALFTGNAAHAAASAAPLQEAGVQVLATLQALDRSPAGLAALEGAWVSTPDPVELDKFRQMLMAAGGGSGGIISALAFDAARLVRELGRGGQLSREGLLASSFSGATGAVRFRDDGRCVRELAIVVPSAGALQVVGRKAAL